MKRKTQEYIRKVVHNNILIAKIYGIASRIKTRYYKHFDDDTFFKIRYRKYTGHNLDLVNPKTFNEKLLWLQIHDRNSLYTNLTDKYLVKQYVATKIGEEHVVPLLGVWEKPSDINFEQLPDEYVLKCNHDCGSTFIKKKHINFDKKSLIKKYEKALLKNYYDVGRVWSYKNIKPLVFAEQLISTIDGKAPIDYKFFCFYGEPKFLFVASDRDTNTKFDFFDLNWNRLPVKQHYPNSTYNIEKPEQFNLMIKLAKILSEGIPHVRVDFYIDSTGKVLFGEMTFCHFSGKEPFVPEIYDTIFGNYLNLDTFFDNK